MQLDATEDTRPSAGVRLAGICRPPCCGYSYPVDPFCGTLCGLYFFKR